MFKKSLALVCLFIFTLSTNAATIYAASGGQINAYDTSSGITTKGVGSGQGPLVYGNGMLYMLGAWNSLEVLNLQTGTQTTLIQQSSNNYGGSSAFAGNYSGLAYNSGVIYAASGGQINAYDISSGITTKGVGSGQGPFVYGDGMLYMLGAWNSLEALDPQAGAKETLIQQSSNNYDGSNAFAGNYSGLALSPVPIPAAAWLFGSALLGLIGLKRRQ